MDRYAAAGVGGVTVWRPWLEGRDPEKVGEALRARGLTVVSLCRGGFFPAAAASGREAAIEDNRTAIREAAALGAPLIVLVCGAAPVVYGWVIFQQGGALVHRFFLPATLACLVTSAAAFGLAWERVSRFSLGPRKLLRISLALLATGVLAVGARDVYYAKIGYLDSVTSSLRQFRQGLRTIEDQDLRNKRILVYGWHWGYANLVLRTGPNTVYRDEILLTTPDPRRFLCECAYVLIRRGNPFVDQLIEQASQGEGDRCLESFWSSPSGEFELFRRAHAGVR